MQYRWHFLACFSLLLIWLTPLAQAATEPVITVTGLVKHPQRLTLEDLAHFQYETVRITEVGRNGTFYGVRRYRGVPLQNLLQLAGVEKEGGTFRKAIDLAIMVRNRHGQRTLLSWAEVAYGRPADVIVAVADESPMNKGDTPNAEGAPVLPRLVLGGDFYNDRCLQDIIGIEVADPAPLSETRTIPLPKPAARGAAEVATKMVWNGSRFDGVQRFSGTPLVDILQRANVADDPGAAVLVRSGDGYRSLLSLAELYWSPVGRRILLADRMDGRPLGDRGERWLVLPDDSANRFVRDVAGIEVLRPQHVPKLSIIGVGPGDTCQITLEALSALAQADAVAAPGDIQRRFARYLTGKEILFDPFAFADADRATPLSDAERQRLKEEEWRGNADKIRKALAAGKDVAFLDWGDPMIFGSSRWIREYLPEEQIETVAGLSSFNAANAVINRDISVNGAIVLTAPRGLRAHPELLAAVANSGDTLAIFMGLPDLPQLVPMLRSHYADATPVQLVYAAGISGREHRVATTLGEVLRAVAGETEKFLGLVYVGPCLEESAPCN